MPQQLMRAANLEPRISGAKGEWGARTTALIEAYRAWMDEMLRRHLPAEWTLTMIVDGMAPAEVDWRSHHEDGWAASRLIEALDLYCRLAARHG
jgi:hypothetical protein